MFGCSYQHIRWLTPDGKAEESWIPSQGFNIDPKAYKLPSLNDDLIDPNDDVFSNSCNTSKEKNVRRKKTAGINIVTFPCGTILSCDELYGSESLSQVLLPIYSLMKQPDLQRDVRVLIHDNACRFAAFLKKRIGANHILQHLYDLDIRVDRHHFKNHIGEKCKANHNPDDCELLDGVNTSIMEQVNSWFGRYRHSARYMNSARFAFYLLLACHLNNTFRLYKRQNDVSYDIPM